MLSIIIPTCNRNDLLAQCLNRLDTKIQTISKEDYEIIVTDDSKQEEAKQYLKKNYKQVKWVAGPELGPAANRNNGAKYAMGEWLVFIDDDCLPDQNLLSAYQAAIQIHSNIKVFEGCIMADRERHSLAEESPVNEMGGYLWSCNFMINKNLFLNELKGFDENFPYAAMEDVEFDYRLTTNGINKFFLKEAYVIHPWRTQKNMLIITLNRFKSTLYFLKKYPEKRIEINSKYYLLAFYNSFFKDTLKNAYKYKFKGFKSKMVYDWLQLYFSFILIFKK
ncbi:MAG: glycosyltransferase family 2 protein [Janthinobacterium lividum]